jgi:hypothetical protein
MNQGEEVQPVEGVHERLVSSAALGYHEGARRRKDVRVTVLVEQPCEEIVAQLDGWWRNG